MIADFKNTAPVITECEVETLLSDYNLFTDMFICDAEYFFGDGEITEQANWSRELALNNLVPAYRIKSIEPNHVDPLKYTGIQDIEVELNNGKYKYDFYYNYDINLYHKILQLHNKPAYVYFFDKNDNVYGDLDGTDIFGIRCELFSVSRLTIGEAQAPSGIKISVVIDGKESSTLTTTKIDFSSEDLLSVETSYSTEAISGELDEVVITVTDQNGLGVTGLTEGQFGITDDTNGTLSFSSFTEDGAGQYTIQTGETITSGTIYLTVDGAVTSLAYDFREVNLVFFDDFSMGKAVTQDGFNQLLPYNWSALTGAPYAFVQDWNIDDTGDDRATFNIYEGTPAGQYWGMVTDSSPVPGDFSGDVEVTLEFSYKCDIPAGDVNAILFSLTLSGVIDLQALLTNTGGEFVTVVVTETMTVPFSSPIAIAVSNLTPAASDYEVVFDYIKVYTN